MFYSLIVSQDIQCTCARMVLPQKCNDCNAILQIEVPIDETI